MDAGQPRGALARMVARAIAQRAALHLRQAGEHGEVLAERLQRLHRGRELEARAFRGGHPLIQDHADRVIDKPQADRGLRRHRRTDSAGIMESNSGRAKVVPRPRRNVRRGRDFLVMIMVPESSSSEMGCSLRWR